MSDGLLLLNRTDRTFKAGFSIIKENLTGLSKYFSLLHPNERAYLDSLRFDRRRASYLLGRVAAKQAISRLEEGVGMDAVFIDSGIFQFPVVKSKFLSNVQVSITHCDDLGLAVAFPEDHPLAVDIEKIDATQAEAFESQLTTEELRLIAQVEPEPLIGCVTVWTIKEALSKVLKTGFMIDFKALEIQSLEKSGHCYTSEFIHCGQYKAVSCRHGDYICSIVLPKQTSCDLNDFWLAFKEVAGMSSATTE